MPEISLVQTEARPTLQSVCDHLHQAVTLLGGLEAFVAKGSRVLLKPNIGTQSAPADAKNTDPRVIESLIILLHAAGIDDILIGESAIVGTDTSLAFKAMGLDQLARRTHVQLIDLKKGAIVKKHVSNPLVLRSIRMSAVIDEVDAVINLPKLKTICAVPVSLGLKNLKGLLPDTEKKRFHHTHLSKAIVDLNQVVKTQLTIVDGIVASELYEPRETNLLLAGGEMLAVDAATTAAIGIHPNDVEYLRLAAEAGLGTIDLEQIEVLGNSPGNLHLNLKKAPDRSEAFIGLFPEVALVDGDACSGCAASLYLSLKTAKAKGLLDTAPKLTLVMGSAIKNIPAGDTVLCLGNCTKPLGGRHFLPGCPFTAMEFSAMLKKAIRPGK